MEILRTQRLKFPRFVNLLSFEFVTGAFANFKRPVSHEKVLGVCRKVV